jgi:hypothetical protein
MKEGVVNPKPLTLNPPNQVTKEPEINWAIKVDEEGVVNFLCKEKGFSEKRVRGGLNSLRQVRLRVWSLEFWVLTLSKARLDSRADF